MYMPIIPPIIVPKKLILARVLKFIAIINFARCTIFRDPITMFNDKTLKRGDNWGES